MENININELIDTIENVSTILESVKAFNKLQEDYIDFREDIQEPVDSMTKALLILHELKRTKSEHILLSFTIEDKIDTADAKLQDILSTLYNAKKTIETTKTIEEV